MDYFLSCCPFIQILRRYKTNEGSHRGTELSTNSVSDSNSVKDGNEEDQDSGTASGDHGRRQSTPTETPAPAIDPELKIEDKEGAERHDVQNDLNKDSLAIDDHVLHEHPPLSEQGPDGDNAADTESTDSETSGTDENRGRRGRRRRHDQQRRSRQNQGGEDVEIERNDQSQSDESWRDQLNHGHKQPDMSHKLDF